MVRDARIHATHHRDQGTHCRAAGDDKEPRGDPIVWNGVQASTASFSWKRSTTSWIPGLLHYPSVGLLRKQRERRPDYLDHDRTGSS